ncbi:MAG: DNA polymerase III subunit delta [Steroidobacteraceae bacterium]
MKTTPEKLQSGLDRGLAPVYLISGDEPLTAGEAADALRAAARAAGFTERDVFFVERANTGPWEEIFAAAQSRSLFAERRLIEVRLPGGKPGAAGGKILQEIVQLAGPELMVLVITGALDREAQQSAWVQALEHGGCWVVAEAVAAAQLPGWIRQRGARLGLKLDDAAVELLAQQTEGNLLATWQELQKLQLAGLTGVGAQEVLAGTTRSGRYDVTQLGEAMLAGDSRRALRILGALRAEGVEPTLVLWSVLQELRMLWLQLVPGPQVAGIWSRNRGAQGAALPRFRQRGRAGFARLTEQAARADRIIKGIERGQAWDEIALLVAEFTSGGAPLQPAA